MLSFQVQWAPAQSFPSFCIYDSCLQVSCPDHTNYTTWTLFLYCSQLSGVSRAGLSISLSHRPLPAVVCHDDDSPSRAACQEARSQIKQKLSRNAVLQVTELLTRSNALGLVTSILPADLPHHLKETVTVSCMGVSIIRTYTLIGL